MSLFQIHVNDQYISKKFQEHDDKIFILFSYFPLLSFLVILPQYTSHVQRCPSLLLNQEMTFIQINLSTTTCCAHVTLTRSHDPSYAYNFKHRPSYNLALTGITLSQKILFLTSMYNYYNTTGNSHNKQLLSSNYAEVWESIKHSKPIYTLRLDMRSFDKYSLPS